MRSSRRHRSYLLVLLMFPALCAAQSTVTSEAVSFQNRGVTLVGTLFRPLHPTAAVVLVHGSGQEKRMVRFASQLSNEGIAVFTYDKRGVGESGGKYAGPEVGTNNIDAENLSLLASDASAAVDALKAHLFGNKPSIGLIGFSQAGWVIPLAATSNRAVTFMVFFSGPVVSAREQLRFQFYTEGKPDFWDTHTETEARAHIHGDADRFQFPDTDPVDALATLSIRGLWLFGGKDVQAPVQLSIERLDALKAKGKRYEYRVFPKLGHNVSSEESVGAAIGWIKRATSAGSEQP